MIYEDVNKIVSKRNGGNSINCADCSERNWQVLCHFTSLQNFEIIAGNGYTALSDVTKSNDPAEGGALEALKAALQSLDESKKICKQTYPKLHKAYFDFASCEMAFKRLQQIVLSISFCEPEFPLALWRAYGDNGIGVSFGVSKEQLEKIGTSDGFAFWKIEYLSVEDMQRKAEQFWKNSPGKPDMKYRKL